MCLCGGACRGARSGDRFVRETARRICFLLGIARRHPASARFLEELRRALEPNATRGDERPAGL